jgi:hypothetical protein
MRVAIKLSGLFLILGILLALNGRATAAPDEKMERPPRGLQARGESTKAPLKMQRQNVTLDPFFLLRGEGAKAWVERIIITLQVAVEKNCPQIDLTGPNFRKALYDLLLSGQPEAVIKQQALASLNQQAKREAVAAIDISRSILIVR